MIKKKKISILLSLFFLTLFMSSINLDYQDNSVNLNNNDFDNLRSSAFYNPDPFYIDDSETGVGAQNWTWAVSQAWCSGSGTWSDPYIIEDVVINTTTPGTRIEIRNSNVPFIMRNCTLYNVGMSNVVKFESVSNATLYNNTIAGSTDNYGLYIDLGSNNTIANNTIRDNKNGMRIVGSDNNTISNNIFKDQSSYAISGYYTGAFDGSDNTTITENLITGSPGGITFSYGYDNIIKNNNITDSSGSSGEAIRVYKQGRHQIIGNVIKNFLGEGINSDSSNYNNISQNTLINIGHRGIWVEYCQYITLKNNTFTDSGLDLLKANTGSPIEEIDSHDIDTSNKINGKTIYYYKHVNNLGSSDFLNAGQIILVDCNDSIISNQELSNGTQGITLFLSHNNTIDSTNMSNNYRYGAYLWESSNNTIKGSPLINNLAGIYTLRGGYNNVSNNVVVNNSGNGIEISTDSPNNTISENFVGGNGDNGIKIEGHNTTITYNNISSNSVDGIYTTTSSDGHRIIGNLISENLDEGIEISSGDNVLLFNNTIVNNGVIGLRLSSVENLTMQYNNLTNDGINLGGFGQDLTSHTIDPTNIVNNKPVYYYTYATNLGASDFINAGQVLLAFCNDSIISNQDLSNGTVGISLFDCKNITVENNNITNFGVGAYNGIYLIRTPFSVIKGNIINGTSYMGIYTASGCPNNTIDNNIINNINMFGIYITSGHNTTISNNTLYDIGKWGITLTSSENCSIIKNNCYNNSERGIYLSGASYYTKIIQNNFTNNQDYGIFVFTGKNITISSNNASGNQKYGIYVKDSQDINISGNIMEDNVEYGLYLEANDDPMVFLNNFTRCGIGFYGSPGEVSSTIADQSNLVNGKTLYIYNSINYLTPNDFLNAGGIVLIQSSHSIISNLEFGEGSIGIYLFHSDNNTFINVDISNEKVYGIHSAFSDFNNYLGCSVNNNTNGIYLDDSDNTTIYWNNINNNSNYGVWDDLGINTTISSNMISGNGVYGINLDGNQNATVFNNTIENHNNYGLTLDVSAESNLIYMNIFIGNVYHAKDDGLYNRWDNTVIGNSWDNITDKDTDDDGVADNSIYNVPGASLSNDTRPMYWDAPIILISSPANSTLFGKTAPSYTALIDEGRGDTLWYEFLETGGNFSVALNGDLDEIKSEQLNQSLWDALTNGTRIIRFYVNDSMGYINFTDAVVFVDKTDPAISIISPSPLKVLGKFDPYYNITITADNFDSVWYTLDGGSNNYSIIGAVVGENIGSLNTSAWNAIISDGTYLLNFYANETTGNIINQSVWVEKDITDPFINITRPLEGITILDIVPNFNYTASDKNLHEVWYSLNNGKNNTVSGNGTIEAGLWNALGDGTVFIRFYANDTAGNIVMDVIVVTKDTTPVTTPDNGGGDPPPGGLDPILMFIIIGAIAGVALVSIVLISKRSKKEVREKEEEIKTLKEQRDEITEDDILISKERHICLVHKGPVEGMSYICPECGAYYCVKCYGVIKEAENECWSCQTPLDASKPSIKKKKQAESKKKKKKEEIKITEEEGEEKIEFEKKMEDPKKHKAPKTDLTSLSTKPTAPEKKLTIRAPVVEKPEEIPEPKPEVHLEAPKKEASITKLEAIKKFDDYIDQLNTLVQKLDIKFSAGVITQEQYIEKKTMIAEKIGEAMAKRDQLIE